jgi:hypothetical protein
MDTSEYRKTLFWNKVWKTEGCWLWAGASNKKKIPSYGNFAIGAGKTINAHVYSLHIHFGDTKGLYVCHTCDVPTCVNPKHLFLGTNKENQDDSVSKGRHVSGTQKLTKEDIKEVISLVYAKVNKKIIASRFNITTQHINRLVRHGCA